MLAAIVYSLGTFVAAAVLTMLWVLTRPVHARDEMRSWRTLLALFILCFSGPYLYNEALTRVYGPEIEKAVQAGYMDVPLDGPLQYFKVTSVKDNKARVLVVAEEKQDWGGRDRPMVSLLLTKDKGKWKSTSFRILNSWRLNRETYVFPIYW